MIVDELVKGFIASSTPYYTESIDNASCQVIISFSTGSSNLASSVVIPLLILLALLVAVLLIYLYLRRSPISSGLPPEIAWSFQQCESFFEFYIMKNWSYHCPSATSGYYSKILTGGDYHKVLYFWNEYFKVIFSFLLLEVDHFLHSRDNFSIFLLKCFH